ncbi:hypothetical protein GCM10010446_04390 [Streptomyces enissocaesilis]|uniref:Uncharacterized protein n=1 Tax=Streptomyces enissocaesilis TaxID=332589 RepID=A0ABN3WRP2_9ACTN
MARSQYGNSGVHQATWLSGWPGPATDQMTSLAFVLEPGLARKEEVARPSWLLSEQ